MSNKIVGQRFDNLQPAKGYVRTGLMAELRSIRLKSNMSLKDSGKLAGVCWKSIGHWERGEQDPKLTNVTALVEALGCKLTITKGN